MIQEQQTIIHMWN